MESVIESVKNEIMKGIKTEEMPLIGTYRFVGKKEPDENIVSRINGITVGMNGTDYSFYSDDAPSTLLQCFNIFNLELMHTETYTRYVSDCFNSHIGLIASLYEMKNAVKLSNDSDSMVSLLAPLKKFQLNFQEIEDKAELAHYIAELCLKEMGMFSKHLKEEPVTSPGVLGSIEDSLTKGIMMIDEIIEGRVKLINNVHEKLTECIKIQLKINQNSKMEGIYNSVKALSVITITILGGVAGFLLSPQATTFLASLLLSLAVSFLIFRRL